MNPEFAANMFLDKMHFVRQMNCIVENNLFKGLTCHTTTFPNYSTFYTLTDIEYCPSTNFNEDEEEDGKYQSYMHCSYLMNTFIFHSLLFSFCVYIYKQKVTTMDVKTGNVNIPTQSITQ